MDQNNSITQTSNETNVDFDKFIFKQSYSVSQGLQFLTMIFLSMLNLFLFLFFFLGGGRGGWKMGRGVAEDK